ncbi:unnamed protein product [Lathyrus sativus]|nr:unnamed protein product [Lathyrus sativus]
MNKEENKKNMKCHVKGQRGASSVELPLVKSSFELARNFSIKLEERKTKHEKICAPITEVEALRNKKDQPLTTPQFKLSMFATTSNKEPEPKKNVSDNTSRTKLPNTHAEKSIEREVSLKTNKGLKIQDPKDQSLISKRNQPLVSKIQNSKGQSLS